MRNVIEELVLIYVCFVGAAILRPENVTEVRWVCGWVLVFISIQVLIRRRIRDELNEPME